jgi:hypothetical protein
MLHKTKKLTYQALVKSILLYGKESGHWTHSRRRNYWQMRRIFGEDLRENQGKKRSEMSPLERSWRWGRTF